MIYDLIVAGAGAGGCFTAIRLAELYPGAKICIVEAAKKPLSKVEISGGGRCNVTHACFDPEKLITYYPRGEEALLGPFSRFHPADMVAWFKSKGVKLKTEHDGRMFPVTDTSSTIIDCFLKEIRRSKIELLTSTRASEWSYDVSNKNWKVSLFDGRMFRSRTLLIATGSDQRTWNFLKNTGHHMIFPVPSLFTFNINEPGLLELKGISKVDTGLSIPAYKLNASGPLLITHWGLSGPGILRLSAWGARELFDCGYVFDLKVSWLGHESLKSFTDKLQVQIAENPKRFIQKLSIDEFPARLWKFLCVRAEIGEYMSGAEFGKKPLKRLSDVLTADTYRVTGKSTFKEEFVTAGGVDLIDIDLDTFSSKKHPDLYLVGEVINIDAITGGFNFQAAWTGAHIAATSMAERLRRS